MSKVLITGTSAGIGLQTAIVLAKAGHSVVATMRNLGRDTALREAVAADRLPISIFQMDVDSDESVAAATAAIRSQAGAIDVLVNNAGIERTGAIETLAFEDFKATMETNYFGAVRTIRAWLPDMREQRRGCIINVSSVAGKIACSPLAPYSASKYTLEALSEALAQEVRPFNVRVAIVQPGIIDTAMARRIEGAPVVEAYPQVHRFGHMFQASLDHPTSPRVVAEKSSKSSKAIAQSCGIRLDPTPRAFSHGAPHWAMKSGPIGGRCRMKPGTSMSRRHSAWM